jgi:anti-sigma factor RsiW
MRVFRRHQLTCEEMVELVTDYVEGALSSRAIRMFEAHLSECDHCTEFLRQIRTTIVLVRSHSEDKLSVARQDQLIAVYRRWCVDPQ